MTRKRSVGGGMRVKAYEVLARAVDEGIAYGYQRAHKYTPTPDAETMRAALERAVMDAIAEVFEFDGT